MPKAPAHSRTARLHALIARARRMGVIFRRGPSSQVRLIRWNLARDTFAPGQWLKARVYEDRCDLSPDGELLCYFAAVHRPYPTYTAISRPPWFTALALWRKGDCWGGGGLFDSGLRLRLNHRPEPYHHNTDEMALGDGFRLPRRFAVVPLWENAGWGEDDPIRMMRMQRDGWTFVQHGQQRTWHEPPAAVGLVNAVPEVMAKPMNTPSGLLFTLRITCHGHFERDGRSSLETAEIVGPDNGVLRDLGRIDWADLDHNGDVLWAWAGKLWRLKRTKHVAAFGDAKPRLLADFNDMRFEPIKSPLQAQRW